MKTTEVFVEQVLIGLLVFLNVGLIMNPNKAGLDKVDLKEGAALVATAYLIGIIFDRFADTVLEDIEQRIRLKLAHDAAAPPREPGEKYKEDPFPEHEYRMKVLQNREAFAYANYLRTRIRLSRAMTMLSPSLSVSFLIGKGMEKNQISVHQMRMAAALMGAIYAGALVAQLIRSKSELIAGSGEKDKTEAFSYQLPWYKIPWYRMPKTNNLTVLNDYIKNEPSLLCFTVQEPFFWLVILLTGLELILARPAGGEIFFAVPLISITVTLLMAWTWSRINKTFLVFLRDYSEYAKKNPSGTNS